MKGFDRALNNQASHYLLVPSFRLAFRLITTIMLTMLVIGLLLLNDATSLGAFELKYGELCNQRYYGVSPNSVEGIQKAQGICILPFTLDIDLVDPRIYYRLDNFYANHRSFVLSRNWQ